MDAEKRKSIIIGILVAILTVGLVAWAYVSDQAAKDQQASSSAVTAGVSKAAAEIGKNAAETAKNVVGVESNQYFANNDNGRESLKEAASRFFGIEFKNANVEVDSVCAPPEQAQQQGVDKGEIMISTATITNDGSNYRYDIGGTGEAIFKKIS